MAPTITRAPRQVRVAPESMKPGDRCRCDKGNCTKSMTVRWCASWDRLPFTPTSTDSRDYAATHVAMYSRKAPEGIGSEKYDSTSTAMVTLMKYGRGFPFHRLERHSGTFSRSVTLPCNVNENEVAAQYNQGVLTVVLPKCDEAKARKITVKS